MFIPAARSVCRGTAHVSTARRAQRPRPLPWMDCQCRVGDLKGGQGAVAHRALGHPMTSTIHPGRGIGRVKGDRVEIVVDAGDTTRTYEVVASRAGRSLET